MPAVPARAPVRAIATTYAGTRVVDPYRYLEDGNDPATRAFFRDRAAYAAATLARLDPARSALRARIGRLEHATETIAGFVREGTREFYLRRGPADDATVLCTRDAGGANERVLVDPERGLVRGAAAAIGTFLPSRDGRFVAYTISATGAEAAELHVLDTQTAVDLPERISLTQAGGATAWLDDARSFVYDRYQPLLERHDPRTERQNAVAYVHIVGRSPEQDTPVFGSGIDDAIPFAPDDVPFVRTRSGSPYAVATIRRGVARELAVYVAPVASLATSHVPWKLVATAADGVTDVEFTATTLVLVDHKDELKDEIRFVPLGAPDLTAAATLLPPGPDVVDGIAAARDALYVDARRGAASKLLRFPLGADGATRGTPQALGLPAGGTIAALTADPRSDGATVALGSWLQPTREYDVASAAAPADLRIAAAVAGAPSSVVADEEIARSADGTIVPMSIVRAANAPRDGRRPALVEVFGAYGRTLVPTFDPARLAWLDHGGIYAICHARGGGWNGEVWHRAGMLDQKPQSAADVVACAQHLVLRGYTRPEHLVLLARGAGALAAGGALVRAPAQFAAVIDLGGITDPVRQQFEATGPANAPEFGSTGDAAGVKSLLAMSPYARVSDLTSYPAVLLATAPSTPAVSAAQPATFAARLEAAQIGRRPILFRVDDGSDRGEFGADRKQEADLLADAYAFGLWQAGDTAFGFVPVQRPPDVGTAPRRSKRTLSR